MVCGRSNTTCIGEIRRVHADEGPLGERLGVFKVLREQDASRLPVLHRVALAAAGPADGGTVMRDVAYLQVFGNRTRRCAEEHVVAFEGFVAEGHHHNFIVESGANVGGDGASGRINRGDGVPDTCAANHPVFHPVALAFAHPGDGDTVLRNVAHFRKVRGRAGLGGEVHDIAFKRRVAAGRHFHLILGARGEVAEVGCSLRSVHGAPCFVVPHYAFAYGNVVDMGIVGVGSVIAEGDVLHIGGKR